MLGKEGGEEVSADAGRRGRGCMGLGEGWGAEVVAPRHCSRERGESMVRVEQAWVGSVSGGAWAAGA